MEIQWLINGVETGIMGAIPLMALTIVISAVVRLLR